MKHYLVELSLVIIAGIVIGLTSLAGSYYLISNTFTRQEMISYAQGVSQQIVTIKEKLYKCTIDPKTLECTK